MSSSLLSYLLLASFLIYFSCSQEQSAPKPPVKDTPTASKVEQDNPCIEFDRLNAQVRDGLIDREKAREQIRELLPRVREYFYKKGGVDSNPKSWVFPLQGYGPSAIGGTNGSGYIAGGYNYFDGNKHKGHPAHDIFIRDKDQDEMDDTTHKPVNVLSMSSGVVVASASEWKAGSDLRGGKYIFIYDPASNGFFYYAHNREIFVEPGKIVKPGDVIATVGRTGKSAFEKRSPTHLHFMYLSIEDGFPKPKDLYQALLSAKRG
jgi:peptidoglycan LD-endopeptidase LytH